jgi:hypothetical protein
MKNNLFLSAVAVMLFINLFSCTKEEVNLQSQEVKVSMIDSGPDLNTNIQESIVAERDNVPCCTATFNQFYTLQNIVHAEFKIKNPNIASSRIPARVRYVFEVFRVSTGTVIHSSIHSGYGAQCNFIHPGFNVSQIINEDGCIDTYKARIRVQTDTGISQSAWSTCSVATSPVIEIC